MSSIHWRNAYWFLVAIAVVALDQASKQLARESLHYHVPVELTDFLNLFLTYNRGAAFSFLGDAGGWQRWFFVTIATVVSVALMGWILRLPAGSGRRLPLALAMVLGGALGNVWDRLVLGAVVDFIDLHIGEWHWPAFNLADSAITLGVGLILWLSVRADKPGPKSTRSAKPSEPT